MAYRTPEALWAALREHSRRRANQTDTRATARIEQEAIRRFTFQRLLARVFTHDPNGWLLKGGQALLVRYPTVARYSRDIDLYQTKASTMDDGVAALQEATKQDLGDHFRFTPRSTRVGFEGSTIARVVFDVRLGTKPLEPLSVDLATSLAPVGRPKPHPLEPVPLSWPEVPWPNVQLYPITDHLADKVCAINTRHNGVPCSRYRDLVDIVLIARQEPLDGRELKTALTSEQTRSRNLGIDLTLPKAFTTPDGPNWKHGYENLAAQHPELGPFRSLQQATTFASTLLDPILADAEPPGQWLPGQGRWQPLPTPTPPTHPLMMQQPPNLPPPEPHPTTAALATPELHTTRTEPGLLSQSDRTLLPESDSATTPCFRTGQHPPLTTASLYNEADMQHPPIDLRQTPEPSDITAATAERNDATHPQPSLTPALVNSDASLYSANVDAAGLDPTGTTTQGIPESMAAAVPENIEANLPETEP